MDKIQPRMASRRQFLGTSVGVTAGMTSWLALGRAPAFAQKRELTFLCWNHFVPASDDELRRQAEAFGKQAGVTVRVDTIAHLQLPAKRAAEAAAQSGHDLLLTGDADPFLFENQLADVGDVIDDLGKQYGGWYPVRRRVRRRPSPAGGQCPGSGSPSRPRTTWRTSRRPASNIRRPGTSC